MRDNACAFAQTKTVDTSNLENLFYVTSIVKVLGDTCKFTFPEAKKIEAALKKFLEGEPTVETIYYAVTTMANLGVQIDHATVIPALVTAVENEESLLSYGQAFKAASVIPEADLSDLFDLIEDTVPQADETPSILYFEGGLKVTSTVISGIFALANRVGKEPAMTELQATKFGNYLLTSKYTSSLADAHHLLSAARALASNRYMVPSALLLAETTPIGSGNKNLKVRLTNILDDSVGSFTVKVTAIEDPEGEISERNKPMKKEEDGVTYSYPLFADISGPGIYKVSLSAKGKGGSPVVDISEVQLSVTVSYQVTVGSAALSLIERDQGITTKSISLDYPNASKETLKADQHTKVAMTFTLLNKDTKDKVTVHQAFIRLTSGFQEIFYVATANDEEVYSFELDVAEAASDFRKQSGTYEMVLLVGDFALENPFSWNVGELILTFTGGSTAEKKEDYTFKAKPVIEHQFNPPEKRPPVVISNTFTVLVLLPLGLLLLLWLLLGANISNISVGGIWTILFHLGLAAIFGLYYCFWTQLNMFQTLQYLVVIGGVTFFSGNRMLRRITEAKQG